MKSGECGAVGIADGAGIRCELPPHGSTAHVAWHAGRRVWVFWGGPQPGEAYEPLEIPRDEDAPPDPDAAEPPPEATRTQRSAAKPTRDAENSPERRAATAESRKDVAPTEKPIY